MSAFQTFEIAERLAADGGVPIAELDARDANVGQVLEPIPGGAMGGVVRPQSPTTELSVGPPFAAVCPL